MTFPRLSRGATALGRMPNDDDVDDGVRVPHGNCFALGGQLSSQATAQLAARASHGGEIRLAGCQERSAPSADDDSHRTRFAPDSRWSALGHRLRFRSTEERFLVQGVD